MPLHTLFELAAKSIAKAIRNETIWLNFPLDTKSSNAIVRAFLMDDCWDRNDFKKLEAFKKQLAVTKIDFGMRDLNAEAIRSLKNFNLISLDIGRLEQLMDDYPDDSSNDETLDIVSLFIQSMSNGSRSSLIHLGLPWQEFIGGWEKRVSKILPNLQSMNISSAIFNDRFQLSNFCTSFSHLLALNISFAYYLPSLQGIGNIKNLQKLSMSYVYFDDINGYKELSDLKSLKYLDISGTVATAQIDTNSIKNLLAAEVRLEALEFLDCSWTSVTEHQLRTFAKNHPSLRTIAAICTPCNQTTIPGIKMINASSLSECLEFLVLTDHIDMASDFMKEVYQNQKASRGNLEISELRQVRKALLFVLRESDDEENKFWTVVWYLESGLLELELSISSVTTDIPHMIELCYNAFNTDIMIEEREDYVKFVLRMFEAVVNALAPGILFPDRALKFVFEKTLDLVDGFPEYQSEEIKIITQIDKWMSGDQYQNMCTNFELHGRVQNYLNST
ncbi:hypothetical protein L3Y34_010561 [Caenorhabditis briggsae]|uniref:Uncharacterized protein n=2 Tax=Caenorhabditis briggsae TaxID=6238 RepID=A0AAE8ZLT1_CAEBR|nr:hypothetical protein L3Y34_010561 [Caenorhabditis briggsae]